MNKKGFTLVEILGVIVIIGLLLLIVAPNLLNRINPKEAEITEIQKKMIEEAAGLYADAHSECSSGCTIGIGALKDEGYLNSDFKKATDKEAIMDNVQITIGMDEHNNRTFTISGYENN